jgi:hypothetical protein
MREVIYPFGGHNFGELLLYIHLTRPLFFANARSIDIIKPDTIHYPVFRIYQPTWSSAFRVGIHQYRAGRNGYSHPFLSKF